MHCFVVLQSWRKEEKNPGSVPLARSTPKVNGVYSRPRPIILHPSYINPTSLGLDLLVEQNNFSEDLTLVSKKLLSAIRQIIEGYNHQIKLLRKDFSTPRLRQIELEACLVLSAQDTFVTGKKFSQSPRQTGAKALKKQTFIKRVTFQPHVIRVKQYRVTSS